MEPNQGYIASRQVQNKASARLVSMAVYYIIYRILIRESMATWTIQYVAQFSYGPSFRTKRTLFDYFRRSFKSSSTEEFQK